MHPDKKEKLLKKGWTEQEIKKAEAILEKTELKDIFFSKLTFWSAFAVIVLANLIVSLILIPFLIVFNRWLSYTLIIVLAFLIGFLYNFLITDIKHLEKKHHLWAGFLLPVFALANALVMAFGANHFMKDLKTAYQPYNLWIVGLVFVAAFLMPYLISLARGKHRFYQMKR